MLITHSIYSDQKQELTDYFSYLSIINQEMNNKHEYINLNNKLIINQPCYRLKTKLYSYQIFLTKDYEMDKE